MATTGAPSRAAKTAVGFMITLCAVIACAIPLRIQGWNPERGPVVPHDSFPGDCSLCHVTDDWQTIKKDFTFDHGAETGFPLVGAHQQAECLRCHNDRGPVELFSQQGCSGCHEDPHQGRLGTSCDACHSQDNWKPDGQIVEHAQTRFPLIGAHATTACFACHEGAEVGNFQHAPLECAACHRAEAERVRSPDHAALGWTNSCERCHQPTSFKAVRFDHPASFPLRGGHRAANCTDCHTDGTFSSLPTDCASCHREDYDGASDPNHQLAGFPLDCARCHGVSRWERGRFEHDSFLLTGQHTRATCNQCHDNQVFAGTPRNCDGCHLPDYERAKSPDHVASSFSTDCMACHSTQSWRTANFNHSIFPLTGKHSALDCSACHQDGVFAGTPKDCNSCHSKDFDDTRNPSHASLGFSRNCESCHGTDRWKGAVFNHPFPITSGPHKKLNCIDCHKDPQDSRAFSCIDCHKHRKSKMDDVHKEERGYMYASPDCLRCHPNGR